jgi:hypothetical protein
MCATRERAACGNNQVGTVADGRWQMADGRWQMADGRWQMADGRLDQVLAARVVFLFLSTDQSSLITVHWSLMTVEAPVASNRESDHCWP